MPSELRDFLYLDVDRVRSLLAQLEGGVVEQTVERLTKSKEARAGATLFGLLDLGGSLVREKASEQTKSLQDATFILFEEAAASAGVLTTTPAADQADSWISGAIHTQLNEGQLIRLTAPTRILDSRHFRERFDRFSQWPRLVASFSLQEQLAAARNPKERERRLDQFVSTSFGGAGSIQLIRDIGEFVELFMGGQISVRQFPCGVERPDLAFVGMLLDRPGFLQEEREALFAKYGAGVAPWTMVAQIATIPEPHEGDPELDVADLVSSESEISRTQFEEIAVNLMRILEETGIAEGPLHPSIAVTPLALYREVATG